MNYPKINYPYVVAHLEWHLAMAEVIVELERIFFM
jgi:hypothetical protein